MAEVVYRGCLVMASTRRDWPLARLLEGGDTDAHAHLRRRDGLEAVRGGEDAVAVYNGAAAELLLVDRVAPRYVAQRRHELVLAVGHRVAAHDLRLRDPPSSAGGFWAAKTGTAAPSANSVAKTNASR
jgi:hypothetical protein